MLINNSKSPKENLLDHINAILDPSEQPILISEVSFSNLRIIPNIDDSIIDEDHPNDNYTHNTKVRITSNSSGESIDLTYRRISIPKQWSILSGSSTLSLVVNDIGNIEEVKAEIAKIWDYHKDEVNFTLSGNGSSRLLKISPIDGAYLYINGLDYSEDKTSIGITITKEGSVPPPTTGKTPLTDILNDTDMDDDNTKSNTGDGYEYALPDD